MKHATKVDFLELARDLEDHNPNVVWLYAHRERIADMMPDVGGPVWAETLGVDFLALMEWAEQIGLPLARKRSKKSTFRTNAMVLDVNEDFEVVHMVSEKRAGRLIAWLEEAVGKRTESPVA